MLFNDSSLLPCSRHAKRKYVLFIALRLRFRLVASDFPGIVCVLDAIDLAV